MSDHASIQEQIARSVEEEKELRAALAAGRITLAEEHERIRQLEQHLDQLWDLLRRRQADRAVGKDPAAETMRTVGQVEGYLG